MSEPGRGTFAAFVATATAVGLLAGCGGGGKDTSTRGTIVVTVSQATGTTRTMPPTQQELAQTYLRIVGPANAAAVRFSAKAKHWDDSTTNAQATTDAAPVIAAAEKADSKLLRTHWPPAVARDIRALVRADGALIGDLRGLQTLDASSAGEWSNQFAQDGGKVSAASNIVRADLGLPPFKQ